MSEDVMVKTVYGWGINDANYKISKGVQVDGKWKKTWVCPFYQKWASMLERSFSKGVKSRQPTYDGCMVCDEWRYFSNFKKWMETQDWEGKELDKDILFKGNRVYSPDTCIFLHPKVNTFVVDCGASRGEYMIGVYWHKAAGKFQSQCRSPFKKGKQYLGLFDTEIEAHTAWKNQKHIYACQLADSEYVDDIRLAEALRTRYI